MDATDVVSKSHSHIDPQRPAWVPENPPCRLNPDLWFAEPGTKDAATARMICAVKCPAMFECLRAAVERGEEWGIWGGEQFYNGSPARTFCDAGHSWVTDGRGCPTCRKKRDREYKMAKSMEARVA